MAEERVKRKLTAILSADAKGYSRLMGEDEAATVQTLKVYREAMTSLIKEHGGRYTSRSSLNASHQGFF